MYNCKHSCNTSYLFTGMTLKHMMLRAILQLLFSKDSYLYSELLLCIVDHVWTMLIKLLD